MRCFGAVKKKIDTSELTQTPPQLFAFFFCKKLKVFQTVQQQTLSLSTAGTVIMQTRVLC